MDPSPDHEVVSVEMAVEDKGTEIPSNGESDKVEQPEIVSSNADDGEKPTETPKSSKKPGKRKKNSDSPAPTKNEASQESAWSSSRPKRERKPRDLGPLVPSEWQAIYVPPEEMNKPKRPRKQKTIDENGEEVVADNQDGKATNRGRRRNTTAPGTVANKWDNYRLTMKRLLSVLSRQLHYVEGYKLQGKSLKLNLEGVYDELKSLEAKVVTVKKGVIQTFEAIEAENQEHHRWPELEQEDEEGLIDLESIMCSVCGEGDEAENDILFCDRKGCLRAYHQKCLSPQLLDREEVTGDDWFCWQCECLDDCIHMTNEILETDHTDWRQFFPDINKTDAMNMEDVSQLEDEEEDDDEDFVADDEDSDDYEEDEGDSEEESEEESGESSSDSDDDSSEEEEGEEDDDDEEPVDEEEMQGLLEESGLSQDEIEALAAKKLAASKEEGDEKGKYNFRERSKSSRAELAPLFSTEDIGRSVARVKRGYLVLGKVTSYSVRDTCNEIEANNSSSSSSSSSKQEPPPEQQESHSSDAVPENKMDVVNDSGVTEPTHMWEILYDDDVTATVDEEELRSLLQYYYEYEREEEKQLSREKAEEFKNRQDQEGVIDSSNIIGRKRSRKSVDYVAMSLEMFGDMKAEEDWGGSEEEDDDFDVTKYEENDTPVKRGRPRSATKKVGRKRKNRKASDSESESDMSFDDDDEEEDDEEDNQDADGSTSDRKSTVSSTKKRGKPRAKKLKQESPKSSAISSFTEHSLFAASMQVNSTEGHVKIEVKTDAEEKKSSMIDETSTKFEAPQATVMNESNESFDSSDLFNLANDLIGSDGINDAVEIYRQE